MDKTTDLHQHCSRSSPQKLETASQITRDAVTTISKTASQYLKTASNYSRLESIEQFLNNFANEPNETNMNNLESDDEAVDTPLVSPFPPSDNDSDDEEVLNKLIEEAPSFDGLKPQPLLNSPSLDVSLGDVIGPETTIKPHSPDSSRMNGSRLFNKLKNTASPHHGQSHPKGRYQEKAKNKASKNDKTGLGMEKTVKDKAKSKPESQSSQKVNRKVNWSKSKSTQVNSEAKVKKI
ncbi:hypothetical protein Tco_0967273 [Tanacetum coccineum]